jgi:hypothetical protein
VFRVRVLLTATFAVLAVTAVALAASDGGSGGRRHRYTGSQGASRVPFQATGSFDVTGNPVPTVDFYPDGAAAAIHWSLCPAPGTGACHPIASREGTAHPGPQPAGTVFKVTASHQGATYSSSVTWRGRVRAVARPVLHGRPHFDSVVTGGGANWAGGWGTETEQLGIEACRTASGTGCVMLSGEEIECPPGGSCGSRGGVVGPLHRPNRARIGNWYTGWYLFALDAHLGTGISGLVGYGSPAAIPPWPINHIVARSKPLGPVTGPPAPQVSVLPRARVLGRHVVVASVRCAVSCHAWVAVSLLRKHLSTGERVGWTANTVIDGSEPIGVWGAIPTGRVAVAINVGDGPYVQGHSMITAAR